MSHYRKVLVVLLALALLATACAAGTGSQAPTAPAATSAPAAGGAAQQIIMKNLKFAPAQVTIKAGTTVTWVNQDGFAHTVTAGARGNPTGLFDSGNVDGGKSFSFTFKDPGTYPYNCAIHPGMDGVITVQ